MAAKGHVLAVQSFAAQVPPGLVWFDCKHLIEHTERHKVVLCTNTSNLEGQLVLTSKMMKGLIPLGIFRKIDLAHRKWLARRDVRRSRAGHVIHSPNGEVCARVLNVSKEADSDSGSDESDSESESENGSDPDEPEVEDDFDSLGNKIARKTVGMPCQNPLHRK